VFWFLKIGLYLLLPAIYISAIYSSFARRDNKSPGLYEQLKDRESELIRPVKLFLKPMSRIIQITEKLLEGTSSTIFLSLALGFVAPLATLLYSKSRRKYLLKDIIFVGTLLLGYVWGVIWFIRIGWFLCLAFLPFAALYSSYKRRRLQIPVEIPIIVVTKQAFQYSNVVHVLILVHSILLSYIWLRDSTIVNPDNAYHVLIAKMLAQKGFFLWDYVEFAPAGRPHLYPPLFHAMVAILGKALGGSPWSFIIANDLVSVGIFSLGLYVSWYIGRKLYGEMGGFLVFTVTSGLLMPALSMAVGLPSALVFIFTPLAALWFLKGKLLPSFLACVASLYSHTSGIVITSITLGMSGFLTKKFRQALKILAISLLVYFPWLLRMLIFLEWFRFPGGDIPINVDYVLLVPAVPGLLLALKRPREHALQLGYLASLVPVVLSYPGRASIQGSLSLTLLAVLFLLRIFEKIPKKHLKKALTIFFLFFYVFPLGPSTIVLESIMLLEENPLGGEISWDIAEQIGNSLKQAVGEYEIVHFQQPYLGCAVATFVPIRIDSGAWGEVAPDDTGGRIGENINTLVIKQLVSAQTDELEPVFQTLGKVDSFLMIKLVPEALNSSIMHDLMQKISIHANETYNLITVNNTKAAAHLSSLELLFMALSIAYRRTDPELSQKIQELARLAGTLSTLLTEEWAKNFLTEERIQEIRDYLLIIVNLAQQNDFSPLLEED